MITYKRHRFPPDIISYAVSREATHLCCIKFGAIYTRRLKRQHRGYGDTFFIDEVFVKINGKQHYLWRALRLKRSEKWADFLRASLRFPKPDRLLAFGPAPSVYLLLIRFSGRLFSRGSFQILGGRLRRTPGRVVERVVDIFYLLW